MSRRLPGMHVTGKSRLSNGSKAGRQLKIRATLLVLCLICVAFYVNNFASSTSILVSTNPDVPSTQPPTLTLSLELSFTKSGLGAMKNSSSAQDDSSSTKVKNVEIRKETKQLVEYPRACQSQKEKFPINWVMFFGDSNMRNTYVWWTTYLNKKRSKTNGTFVRGSTYGVDTAKDYARRWADQEVLFPPLQQLGENDVDQSVQRYSFRFLHGSGTEFVHDARNWDIPRTAAPKPKPEDISEMLRNRNETSVDGGGSGHEDKRNDEHDSMWEGRGWGGVPRWNEIDIVKNVVKGNPETLFIWAPLYVTDRTPERYNHYVEAALFSWSEPNLRTLDLWNMVQTLPKPHRGKSLYHVPAGGSYMKKFMSRIWNEVTLCSESNETLGVGG
ncbi:hypothetical protein FRACYDRAFT_242190 [Fragilariopsis cylindrus CCMP1102]|uniref:Uncharacterized protein n=1 Tax=Fragilariopsis cylindrus CCMP1102 TaxID=635003 RepID=A0A1E7F6L3_9STRA|nr:hypothetical protein FRACYDRAFT_242190 [Fragilariopsis cylindrus CCMP1102]|eukprot:OEU13838.1 hypothetical protein FRACYDRAFT_242190 [Fragilariopsis cylindrus CCMP1102]